MIQDTDGQPLDELPDLLQSEVMAAPVLLGAQAEREAIEAAGPVFAQSRAEAFKALRRKAPSLRQRTSPEAMTGRGYVKKRSRGVPYLVEAVERDWPISP
ncbi:hypothetical protein [Novosphingobium sp. P6W]|uniref:hypothetical protein n=1 Tax=Novosphingobium sp. P6W TaxID=1609758 RepID=UPI0013B39572|nr:hypothetical protein [Novosphingobium sp. P6W]